MATLLVGLGTATTFLLINFGTGTVDRGTTSLCYRGGTTRLCHRGTTTELVTARIVDDDGLRAAITARIGAPVIDVPTNIELVFNIQVRKGTDIVSFALIPGLQWNNSTRFNLRASFEGFDAEAMFKAALTFTSV